MINNKEEKLKKLLFDIINKLSKDADVYHHNGSLWLINTDSTTWVVEYTKDETLWFNYNFFRSAFKFVSLDINNKTNYVTEWFESRFLDLYTVKTTEEPFFDQDQYVQETIENGVKDTKTSVSYQTFSVEETIQKGVKETGLSKRDFFPKDIIKNGVRMVKSTIISQDSKVEDTIQNGIKDTKSMGGKRGGRVGNTIENGIKETLGTLRRTAEWGVDDIIQNGVKDLIGENHHRRREVVVTIKDGVKETHQDCSNNIARVGGIIRVGEKLD